MRAVVCHEPFSLGLADRSEPAPGPGEVLIRILRVGLCGTDYHIFSGAHPFLAYPRVMGHELSGEVAALGPGTSLRIGQRVAINPYLACGSCVACRKGKPNACVRINVLGVHSDGGMCDLLVVPEASVIDAEGLTAEQAAMVEFLAIGAHAVARAPAAGVDHMLVVGAGPIGVATALFGRLSGFSVTLVDRSVPRLDFARDKLGLEGVPADDELDEVLSRLTGGDMFDLVFDATGSLPAMRRSLSLVAHGGALVFVGVTKGEISFANPEFHKRETTLIASRNALASDFERVIAAIRSGTIPADLLQTHALAPEELPAGLPELIAGSDTVLKAIVNFEARGKAPA